MTTLGLQAARLRRTWRRTEFTLLCVVATYVLVGMFLTNAGLSLTAYDRVILNDWQGWVVVAVAFAGILFLANLFIFPALEFEGDQLLFPLVAFLCATSLLLAAYLEPALFQRGVYLFEFETAQARPDYEITLFDSIPYLSRAEFAEFDVQWTAVNNANQAVREDNACDTRHPAGPCPPVSPSLTWHYHLYDHFSKIVIGLVALFAVLYDPLPGRPPWFRRPAAFLVTAVLAGGVLALVAAQGIGLIPAGASILGFNGRKLLLITALLIAARYLNERTIRRPVVQAGVLGLGALALLGAVITGDLTIPLIGIQVSELLKLLLVVFFAGFGSRIAIQLQGTSVRRQLRLGLGLMGVFGVAAIGMFLLADLGAILVFTTILTTYLFLLLPSRTVWPMLLVSVALVVGLGLVGYYVMPAVGITHVQGRIDLWLNPWTQQGVADGEQIIQALRALKYAGLTGQGLGQGRSHVIPAAHTDMPFPVIIEQTGWAGGVLIVGVYLALLLRGYSIAVGNIRLDRALLAAGLTALIGFQTFIILGGSLGAIPFTGITVPFISLGGSAMLLNFIYLGLLLRLSDDDAAAPTPVAPELIPYDSQQVRSAIPHLAALTPLLFVFALVTGAGRVIHYREELATLTDPLNPWVQVELDRTLRGAILDRNGNPLVESLERGGSRVYPDALLAQSLAQTLGYHSDIYGSSGLELAFDARLNGTDRGGSLTGVLARIRYLIAREIDGRDVETTLDPDLQKMVYGIMRDPDRVYGAGAALLMEPQTGAIRAIVSVPTFDPAAIEQTYVALTGEEAGASPVLNAPLLNRVTQGAYAPGSVFKILTAAAALDAPTYGPSGQLITPEAMFSYSLQLPPGPAGYSTYWHGNDCATTASYHGYATFDFTHALAYSDNVVFAEVGQAVGPVRFRQVAERFGIGQPLDIGVEVRTSTLSSTPNYLTSACGLPQTAFGQGELSLTPLQVALIAAAVANEGEIEYPHLVSTPEVAGKSWRAIDADTAAQVKAMMVAVVEDELGSGAPARIPGVQVAGKTGTAETAGAPHAWFVGFAPAEAPQYLVVVILEHHGEGSLWAAPIARDILAGALAAEDVTQP